MIIEGKNIVLTGGSSGIGLALLTEFLTYQGVKVFVVDLNPIPTELHSLNNVWFKKFDLAQKEEIDNTFAQAKFTMGSIDIFIANAGYGIYDCKYENSFEDIRGIFDLNTLGPIYAANLMKKEEGANMTVFVASAMAELALPGYALYAATKAALLKYADAYQLDSNSNKRLMTVLPIATKTNFFKNVLNEEVRIPWPTMSAKAVASSIVKGIQNDKVRVYPSLLNRVMRSFLAIHELLHLPYQMFYRKS